MKRSRICIALLFLLVAMLASPVHASLTPVVENGSFTGVAAYDSVAAGWEALNATPDVADANGPGNNTGIEWTLSPDGGTFAKLNGTVDPVFQEVLGQTIGGFTVGQSYTLNFFITNLGFYYSRGDEWRHLSGYIEFYLDDTLVGQSQVVAAPATKDTPIQWVADSVHFVATSTTHVLKLKGRTAESDTAYMAIDGVSLASEVCDNGIDDDGDGLIDNQDEDCNIRPPVEDLKVRCLHEPIYPQPGEEVTITASAIDGNGNTVLPETAEIFIGDLGIPYESRTDAGAIARYTPTSGQFSYGCRVTVGSDTAQSWSPFDSQLRSVDVGELNNPDWKAVPVIYNGPVAEKIDVVFFHDDTQYTDYKDPLFLQDVHDLIDDGIFRIPWFVEFQWAFNFWIATANTANADPESTIPPGSSQARCQRDRPERLNRDYGYREVGAIVHKSNTYKCRDNAGSGRLFTVEMERTRLEVVSHEMGHQPFGLADEYCVTDSSGALVCDGGYFSTPFFVPPGEYRPPYPNLFGTEDECQSDAANRLRYDATDCRSLTSTKALGRTWWLGEPEFRVGIPPASQVRDLMQQTGVDAAGNDRYQVGPSEIDRLSWFLSKCLNGDC